MTLGELGRELGISPSTVTRNVDRLTERGLVRREPSPHDRRSSRVVLTPDGREAAAIVDHVEQEFAADILGRLRQVGSTDVVGTVERLVAAVQAATERCCSGAFEGLVDPDRVDERTLR
jgi:DNA-binding MarR family transcriptional regulator